MILYDYLKTAEERCRKCFEEFPLDSVRPRELYQGTVEYFNRGGKRLRPAILMLSAGATGGRSAEESVTSAACAVELFHTFTLVHDDIIDNDPTRRGGKSVHVLVSDMFPEADRVKRDEYGRDTAILAGDMLHALSVRFMLDTVKNGISPATVMSSVEMLENECLTGVLEGEAIDTRAGLITDPTLPFSVGSREEIIYMMQKKTGVLFSVSAKIGAMLGLDTPDVSHPDVAALGEFASSCGIAFQLQDDILGVTGDEKKLGKPIGSDIREGKRTLILNYAYGKADSDGKALIERVVGNKSATDSEILAVRDLFASTGAIEDTRRLALEYIETALDHLEKLSPSAYTEILGEWADFMARREL